MGEVARILAFASAALIVMSFGIWAGWLRGPMLQRLDGRKASNTAPAAVAINLLILGFAVSLLAAILAILGWIWT
jgi:hypothetical protein